MNKRDYSLDMLKIISCIFILFYNYQAAYRIEFDGINFCGGRFNWSGLAQLFFIISGFLMYKNINRIEENQVTFKDFFLKKYLRFLPLLLITSVVYTILLNTNVYDYSSSVLGHTPTLFQLLLTAFGINTGWGYETQNINNPSWFVSVLLLCYVLFYIIILISKKSKINRNYLFVFIILSSFGILFHNINFPFINTNSIIGFIPFFIGLLLAEYLNRNKVTKTLIKICYLIIVIMILLFIFFPNFMVEQTEIVMSLLFYPSLIIIFKYSSINKLFKSKSIGTLSKITFDVYIWSFSVLLIIKLVLKNLGVSLSILENYPAMLIASLLCILVGVLSYYLIEKRIQNKIDKLLVNK